jgi:hypothetical protein
VFCDSSYQEECTGRVFAFPYCSPLGDGVNAKSSSDESEELFKYVVTVL